MSNETCRVSDWSPEARKALLEVLSRDPGIVRCAEEMAATPPNTAAARLERVVERFERLLCYDFIGNALREFDLIWRTAEAAEDFLEKKKADK